MQQTMSIEKVTVKDKLTLFTDHWNPRIVGELNGQHVKLVKFQGEFVWHKHNHEDEMFFVIDGSFEMHLRDKVIELQKNDFIVIPKGTEHKPLASNEVHVMLFEPAGTINTGDAGGDKTVRELGWV